MPPVKGIKLRGCGRASGSLWPWQDSTWQASFSWNAASYLCMDRAACPPALLAVFLGCPGWWVVGGGQWAEERLWKSEAWAEPALVCWLWGCGCLV